MKLPVLEDELQRSLDPSLTDHRAEAAEQHVDQVGEAAAHVPEHRDEAAPGYYDLPVIKAPPWKWYVAAYLYAGGVAGASAVLAGALKATGRSDERALQGLATKLRVLALAGEATGAALLIADLGRPERFLHMMRVFRPTSPMNVGTWILSTSSSTSGIELVRHLLRRGQPERLNALTAVNMISGAMLTTYTGVLVGNTAVPVWKAIRTTLPIMFAAAAGSSVASWLELIGASSAREAVLVRRFSIATKVATLASGAAVDLAAGSGIVGAPLRTGTSGNLWQGARVLQIASLVATAIPGRRAMRIAGLLGTIAGVAARFAVIAAGRASAAEPRATLTPDARQ